MKFTDQLQHFAEDVETVFLCPYDMKITPEQEEEFKMAVHCHICEQPFLDRDKRVRHHCHPIPRNNYRGP